MPITGGRITLSGVKPIQVQKPGYQNFYLYGAAELDGLVRHDWSAISRRTRRSQQRWLSGLSARILVGVLPKPKCPDFGQWSVPQGQQAHDTTARSADLFAALQPGAQPDRVVLGRRKRPPCLPSAPDALRTERQGQRKAPKLHRRSGCFPDRVSVSGRCCKCTTILSTWYKTKQRRTIRKFH